MDYKNGNERSELESNNSETDVSRQYGDNARKQTAGYVGDETFTNSETFKDQLANLDFSAVNQEVASVEGMDRRKYEVVVDSFIPFETLDNPYNSLPGKEDTYFHGDNRGPFEEGTSRMKQTFVVETDPNKSQDPLLQKNDYQAITTLYDNEGNEIESKQANSKYTSVVSRTAENDGDNVQIDVTGHGKNPLLDYPIIPAIDYEYQINIQPNQDGSSTIRVTGEHDGFPAHSVQVTDMENGDTYQMHQFEPNSKKEVLNLVPIFPNEIVDSNKEQKKEN